MARKENNQRQTKEKKSLFKKIIRLLLLIVVLLGLDYVRCKIPNEQGETEVSWIETIIEVVNYDSAENQENSISQTEESSDVSSENTNVVEAKSEKDDTVANTTNFDDSKLEVYFFDVGQADSILILTDDKAMLVDSGNPGDATVKNKLEDKINLTYELNRLGVDKIDICVGTHSHEDHIGSMYKILQAFEIGDFYANAHTAEALEKRYYERLALVLEEKNIHMISPTTLSEKEIIAKINEYNASLAEDEEKVVYNADDYIRVGDEIEFGDAKVTMLAPNSAEYLDINDTSIVLMVEFEGVKLLLTGDAGKESEEEMLKFASEIGFDLDCDILKVGHHGSRTASTEEFIAATKPEYAVVMVGKFTEYGLPDEDVIERLENHGATIYQTIDVGDIKLTIDDGEYEFDLTYAHQVKEKE